MSEQLGVAELETGVDLAGLDRGLVRAEARVARSVAVMQKMLDSLEAHVDVRASAIEAAAARVASAPVANGASERSAVGASKTVVGPEVWGIRGPQHAGSLTNPIVTVLAASKYYPMGSYGAAIGHDNVSDEQRGDQGSGLASASDMAALTAAVGDLASAVSPGSRLATAGSQGLAEPGAADRTIVELDRQNGDALGRAAAAMEATAAALGRIPPRSGARSGAPILVERRDTTINQGGRTFLYERGAAGSGPAMFAGARQGSATGAGVPFAYSLAGGGGGGNGPIIPIALGNAGGGGGGNRRVDVFYHRSGEGGGGGGAGLLASLGIGGGTLGMAAAGSLASFAGFGFEHLLTIGLSILGSAASAGIGGGFKALGALGPMAVGAGSDLGVMKSTIADTQTLSKAISNLSTAQATYGKNSRQAALATKQLNVAIAQLGNTAGVHAEVALAKAGQALNHYFDLQTSQARVQAVKVLMQAVQAGYTFVPLIAQAAERNLGMISTDLHPLFAWLTGPEGVGIFQDLENIFARNLPYAMHAFTNAVELLMRVVDIAAQHTGGFTRTLDRLFTRWNSMDNAQLSQVVNKYIADFQLWERFVKLLIIDLHGLFRNDVGTGNSIIGTLDGMLARLHAYENSARGSAEIQNIFMVHKTEVLELLQVLRALGDTFGHVYMAIAPSAVTAMNDVVLPVLNDVGKALAFIAKQSPLASTALGLFLISAKMGGLGKAVGMLGGLSGFLLGTGVKAAAGAAAGGAAAAGAEATAATAGGAALRGLPALLARGAGMVPGVGAMTAEAVGGLAAAAMPIMLAAGGAAVLVDWFLHNAHGPAFHATPGNVTGRRPIPAATSYGPAGSLAEFENRRADALRAQAMAAGFKPGDALYFKKIGDYANFSTRDLRRLVAEMKVAGSIKVNGVGQPAKQAAQQAEAALKVREAWDRAFNQIWSSVHHFYIDAGRGIAALDDDYQTHLRRIASASGGMGLTSRTGKKLAATVTSEFVTAVTKSMLDGKVAVNRGLDAIDDALRSGMQRGYESWATSWRTMFSTVTTLYDKHVIDSRQYQAQLRQIMRDGDQHIRQDTHAAYVAMVADLKAQQSKGLISTQQLKAGTHQAFEEMNAQTKTDMSAFAAQIVSGFATVTQGGGEGLRDLIRSVNSALKLLGQKPLTGLQVSVMGLTAGKEAQLTGRGAASGALWQIGQPGQAGRDSVPLNVAGIPVMVAPGEQVAVFNRHQLPIVNQALASYGGLPGLFSKVRTPNYMASGGMVGGGYSYGQLEGLWDRAGGAPSMASLMAAIALAESGGNPGAYNPSGASGLWQILGVPFAGNPMDPLTNARMAVSKLASQGLGAWVTYTDGAYRQFLHGGVPVAGGLADILAPGVKGGGVLGDITRAALQMVAHAANSYLGRVAPAGAGGAGGFGPSGGGFSPSQLGTFDGLPVAKWIIPELLWARQHGWSGHVTSGYRPASEVVHGEFATAPQGQSEHRLDIYPGGAVDVSDYQQFAQIIAGYPGADRLIQLGIDPLHFSGTGHAAGGLIGMMLAGGGLPTGHKPSLREQAFIKAHGDHRHRSARKPSKLKPNSGLTAGAKQVLRNLSAVLNTPGGHIGIDGPFPFAVGDLDPINATLSQILSLDGGQGGTLGGGDAAVQSGLVQWFTNLWSSGLYPSPNFSSWANPSDFVISTDAAGNPITPYVSPNLPQVLAQLGQIAGYQGKLVGDLTGADTDARSLAGPIQAAIARRAKMVASIRARIKANVARIKALQAKIAAIRKQIERERRLRVPFPHPSDHLGPARPPYPHPRNRREWAANDGYWRARQTSGRQRLSAERAANTAFDRQRKATIAGLTGQIGPLQQQIGAYEFQNSYLGGAPLSIGSGGELAQIMGQLGSPASSGGAGGPALGLVLGTGSGASGLYDLLGIVQGWDTQLSGVGGDIDQQQMQLALYQQGIGALSPGASAALAAAVAQQAQSAGAAAGGSGAGTGPSLTGTTAFSFQGQQVLASLKPLMAIGNGMASGGLLDRLARMPPFAGVFHTGGVVPGPVGAERMILAEGGETILPADSRNPAGGAPVSAAIDRLVQALGDHQRTVGELTAATRQNTTAVSSTGGPSRYVGLSSERMIDLGVGA